MSLALRWLTGVPYLCYVHGEDVTTAATSRELRFLAGRVLRRAACVIANSHNTERILLDDWRLPRERVLLTMDGFRYPDAADKAAGSYFDRMRRAFRAKAEALGYEIIDLDPAFFERHRQTGEKFEYPMDGHWNATGHQVAFEAVMASRLIKSLAHSVEHGAGGKVRPRVE